MKEERTGSARSAAGAAVWALSLDYGCFLGVLPKQQNIPVNVFDYKWAWKMINRTKRRYHYKKKVSHPQKGKRKENGNGKLFTLFDSTRNISFGLADFAV